jgi:trehalose-6-phosphatase
MMSIEELFSTPAQVETVGENGRFMRKPDGSEDQGRKDEN